MSGRALHAKMRDFVMIEADNHTPKFASEPGVSEDLVRFISAQKNEPEWMLQKRLKGYKLFEQTKTPTWGPDLSGLDLNRIVYYADPNAEETQNWDDLPQEIRDTFDKLGIPEAEKNLFMGVGAQYDSNVVYHNLHDSLKKQGVIFENMDVAVQKYPDLVKKYFMTQCVPVNDHKFVMLHAAVWSGGTFIYVPKNVKVSLPLQAYFRMNQKDGGQFEHTLIILDEGAELEYIEGCSSPRYQQSSLHAGCVELIVMPGATMRYTSIENWSKNVYNLNTKRAIVQKNARVEWVNGNMGSTRTMLYPTSVLVGEGASSESVGIAFAGPDQDQDTGSKVIHAASNTKSVIIAKSISRTGCSSYRGLVKVMPSAKNVSSTVQCDAMLIDGGQTKTYPYMQVAQKDVKVSHEATVSRVNDDQVRYLQSRGLSGDDARKYIVSGFVEPIVRSMPLEYAVELNKLIELEVTGI